MPPRPLSPEELDKVVGGIQPGDSGPGSGGLWGATIPIVPPPGSGPVFVEVMKPFDPWSTGSPEWLGKAVSIGPYGTGSAPTEPGQDPPGTGEETPDP